MERLTPPTTGDKELSKVVQKVYDDMNKMGGQITVRTEKQADGTFRLLVTTSEGDYYVVLTRAS